MSDPVEQHVRELDESSALVRVDAAAPLGALDAYLFARGLRLHPLPPESLARTVGEALGWPRPSEASPRLGRFTGSCAALTATLPGGTIVTTRLAPRKATGPDYVAALVGARGRTGTISAAWLRLRRRPPDSATLGFRAADGAGLLRVLRDLLARDLPPLDARLVDEALLGAGSAALLLLRFEGPTEVVRAEAQAARALVEARSPETRRLPDAAAHALLAMPVAPRLAERFVPLEGLPAAFAARGAPTLLCGFYQAGAALCTAASADAPLDEELAPEADRFLAALQRALGEGGAPDA